jgi:hypothetical protein
MVNSRGGDRPDESRRGPSDEREDRTRDSGALFGRSASDRANELARGDEGDLTRDEGLGGVPVMPAGAAVGSGSLSSGTAGSAAGAGAAAVALDQSDFGQDDVRTGWPVLTADDATLGDVVEVGPERILVERTDREGRIYIPYTGVRSLDDKKVRLGVASAELDDMDWQQILPQSARPVATAGSSDADDDDRPGPTGGSRIDSAPPVTTGRGVEEGPTSHVIRTADRYESEGTAAQYTAEPGRVGGAQAEASPIPLLPPTPPKEMGPMRDTRSVMDNVRETFQSATHGQMSPNEPKEAFADMFSFLENIPNSVYYLATVGSVLTSLWLFLSGKRWESLFVGLWAPTIVSASMFYKLLRPSHEVRRM